MSRKKTPISKTPVKKETCLTPQSIIYPVSFIGGKNEDYPWLSTAKGAGYP
jgi:hypothetical protein